MSGRFLPFLFLAAAAILPAASPDTPPAGVSVSAAQIVDKNVSARGGLQAWRSVQAMSLQGKLTAGGNQRPTLPASARKPDAKDAPKRPTEEVQLPFVMELKRPHMMRFELQFEGKTALQVFNGTTGWKVRPFLNRTNVEPYTPEEMKIASMQADLDGPLVDYAAKGTRLEYVGMDKVEGRDTYEIKLHSKDGRAVHVWINAQTYLEEKIEGEPRKLDGVEHPVEVYFRDYRPVNGLQIPFLLETKVLPQAGATASASDHAVQSEKTIIEKVIINPKLDQKAFTKPEIQIASNLK